STGSSTTPGTETLVPSSRFRPANCARPGHRHRHARQEGRRADDLCRLGEVSASGLVGVAVYRMVAERQPVAVGVAGGVVAQTIRPIAARHEDGDARGGVDFSHATAGWPLTTSLSGPPSPDAAGNRRTRAA